MADTTFSCGQHKGKRYQDVFEKNIEYCFKALTWDVENQYQPAEFKEFCRSKEPEIRLRIANLGIQEPENPGSDRNRNSNYINNFRQTRGPQSSQPLFRRGANSSGDFRRSSFGTQPSGVDRNNDQGDGFQRFRQRPRASSSSENSHQPTFKRPNERSNPASRYDYRDRRGRAEPRSSATSPIREVSAHHFLSELSRRRQLYQKLVDIIGDCEVQERLVEGASTINPNGFLGVFYRFFVKKCIFNVANTAGHCKFVEEYGSIFPIKITVVGDISVPVMSEFDQPFKDEVRTFLESHFEDVDLESTIREFLGNISVFQSQNFSESQIKVLRSIVENSGQEEEKLDVKYLETFPRLSDEGARRFRSFYNLYKGVAAEYQIPALNYEQYDRNYFLRLPEINMYELFTLLEEDFYRTQRERYIRLFLKYVFFFERARKSENKPVFFIDDALFECLKYFLEFKNSRKSPEELMEALAAMTLLHRRKQPGNDEKLQNFRPNPTHLASVKKYIESLPEIESAMVEKEVETEALVVTPFFHVSDSLFDMCFSSHSHSSVNEFYRGIVLGAFFPQKTSKLVIYNAYQGKEYSISMPEDGKVEEIRAFVKEHNKFDFSKKLSPEKFLTWGYENCYVPGTIDVEVPGKATQDSED